jgi:hypothetical protein
LSEHKIVNIDLEESETVTLGGRSGLDHIDVSGGRFRRAESNQPIRSM